jgi:hypothetical protein
MLHTAHALPSLAVCACADPHVLDIRGADVIAYKMEGEQADNPILLVLFMVQQIDCVRNTKVSCMGCSMHCTSARALIVARLCILSVCVLHASAQLALTRGCVSSSRSVAAHTHVAYVMLHCPQGEVIEGSESRVAACHYIFAMRREYEQEHAQLRWRVQDFMLAVSILSC